MVENAPKVNKEKTTLSEIVTREFTIHLHKLVHGTQFKKRAPKAIKCIRKFAADVMRTTDVRIDPELNKAMWANGVKTVPHRVRVRISRKRNDNEDAKEKLYAFVSFVNVVSFKGLQNETVDDE